MIYGSHITSGFTQRLRLAQSFRVYTNNTARTSFPGLHKDIDSHRHHGFNTTGGSHIIFGFTQNLRLALALRVCTSPSTRTHIPGLHRIFGSHFHYGFTQSSRLNSLSVNFIPLAMLERLLSTFPNEPHRICQDTANPIIRNRDNWRLLLAAQW